MSGQYANLRRPLRKRFHGCGDFGLGRVFVHVVIHPQSRLPSTISYDTEEIITLRGKVQPGIKRTQCGAVYEYFFSEPFCFHYRTGDLIRCHAPVFRARSYF